MRVINLANRPFHNRRPVGRLAVMLWIIGGLLLAVNLWKWGGHFQGSSTSSDRLDLLERQVSQEEVKLQEHWQELRRVRLGSRNQKARYLNLLIHRRTFPWSRLFGQIEKVLPDNVYLEEVTPDVNLATGSKRKKPKRARAMTPKQARELARLRAAGQAPAAAEEAEEAVEKAPRDRVVLTLGGFARTEEALFRFVDLLYAHDSFLDPNLSRESAEASGGAVDFRIKVVYLTPPREVFPVEIEELPAEEGEASSQTASSQRAPSQAAPAQSEASSDLASSALPLNTSPAAGEAETTARSLALEQEKPALERSGRGFVEQTLRERRERAARAAQERSEANSEASEETPTDRQQERGSQDRQRAVERATPRAGSSRVSVAPRQRPGAAAAPSRPPTPRTQTTPQAPQETTRPTPQRPTTLRPTPAPRGEAEIDRPTPAQPGASSSPRLRGMLNLLPDFLRPELTIIEEAA